MSTVVTTPKMEAKTKISKARTQLLLDRKYVFWATIGLYMKPIELSKDSPMWPSGNATMATDGTHLYYCPEFVGELTPQELMGVLAHEAGHCALGHHLRRQRRDPIRWNVAADYALNLVLTTPPSSLTLPKNCLLDKKWENQSSEEIYAKLKVLKIPQGWCIGSVMDAAGGEAEAKKWDIIIRQAAQVAKAQGHLPGGFEHLLEPVQVKVDLQTLLRHMFSIVQEDDYTWARPNRRHVWQDLYLPSQRTESVGDILVGVDCSGSVSDEMLAKFVGVVNNVLTDLHPRTVYFVQCDAAIQKVEEFKKGDLLPSKIGIKGRGGTDMRPIWDWVEKENKQVSAAVVCSDFQMDVASFGPKQEFPVVWATCEKGIKAPWGVTARVED